MLRRAKGIRPVAACVDELEHCRMLVVFKHGPWTLPAKPVDRMRRVATIWWQADFTALEMSPAVADAIAEWYQWKAGHPFGFPPKAMRHLWLDEANGADRAWFQNKNGQPSRQRLARVRPSFHCWLASVKAYQHQKLVLSCDSPWGSMIDHSQLTR